MSNSFDTNISNYSISELFAIIDLDGDTTTKQSVNTETNKYINQYKSKDQSKSNFFKQMQGILLNYLSQSNTSNSNQSNNSSWITNDPIKQSDSVQSNKNTDRNQKVDVYSNSYSPMTREQLGVVNSHNITNVQDTLNPTLKNTINRFVNLDSQFRQSSNTSENSSTDYTLDLSDHLLNVLNLKLYSYQIPYTWYLIDTSYGNTCFWITYNNIIYTISISSGNYTSSQLMTAINASITSELVLTVITQPTPSIVPSPFSYDDIAGKVSIDFTNLYSSGVDITLNTIKITFFDYDSTLQCDSICVNKTMYFDRSLGWLLGFRVPYIYYDNDVGNTGMAFLNIIGTKYLMLSIDEYNQNHINNGIVSISELSKKLKVPSYFPPSDIKVKCTPPVIPNNNLEDLLLNQGNNPDIGLLIADKINTNYSNTVTVLPTEPRVLTQSQIYTMNEIVKNNKNTTNYRSKAPTNGDIFSVIPIKASTFNPGSLIVEMSGPLQDNIRSYFGPVNIERMRIKLLDDKGNILNLNGADWCVTLIAEMLYQY